MAIRQPLYVDSCAFITAFEASARFTAPAKRLFESLHAKRWALVTSELTLAELIAPVKNPNAKSIAERRILYRELFDDSAIVVAEPVSRSILIETSDLRETHSLKLADAIHIATALACSCRFFLTCDTDARRLPPSLRWVNLTDDDIGKLLEALDA